MRKVLITLYKNRCHSLYNQFIYDPPEGYQYFTLDDFTDRFIFEESNNIFIEVFNKIKRNQLIIKIAKDNNIDIIYCTSGMLLFNSKIPWVVEFESVTSFIIHKLQYWGIIKKVLPLLLKQKKLKALIPWTNAASNSLLSNVVADEEIKDKIFPVHLCLKNEIEYIDEDHDNIFTVLFVTTVNDNGVDKQFYVKGGRILIEIIKKLKNKTNVKFIVRSKLPRKYKYLENNSNVEVYENLLPEDEFKKLFLRSDLLLFPCYQSPGLVFFDAMNFGLSIVTTNIFANSEMVINGYNGFLVNFPIKSSVNYIEDKFGIKGVETGKGAKEDIISEEMIEIFCQKITKLSNDKILARQMSKNSKSFLHNQFTLGQRNSSLKEVFDRIITN